MVYRWKMWRDIKWIKGWAYDILKLQEIITKRWLSQQRRWQIPKVPVEWRKSVVTHWVRGEKIQKKKWTNDQVRWILKNMHSSFVYGISSEIWKNSFIVEMIVETKDFQQLPENRGKAWNAFFPKTFRRNMAHLKNCFQTSRHMNYKRERKKSILFYVS